MFHVKQLKVERSFVDKISLKGNKDDYKNNKKPRKIVV